MKMEASKLIDKINERNKSDTNPSLTPSKLMNEMSLIHQRLYQIVHKGSSGKYERFSDWIDLRLDQTDDYEKSKIIAVPKENAPSWVTDHFK